MKTLIYQCFFIALSLAKNDGRLPVSLSPMKDMCRWVAKHIVAAGLAKHCEVQVSYAIGKAEPVSVEVLSDCKALTADELSRRVKEAFSFKPADIIEALGLKNPIFSATTNYGHFGKVDLPWEKLDPKKLDKLRTP